MFDVGRAFVDKKEKKNCFERSFTYVVTPSWIRSDGDMDELLLDIHR